MRNLTFNAASGCVMARISRNRQAFSRNFSLRRHGSREAAEAAALAWLEEIRAGLPPPVPAKGRKTRRNASGMVGVHLRVSTKLGEATHWTHLSWHAYWPGNPGGSSWGVGKYGDERAFVCACLARRHETTDRAFIEAEYQRIRGTAEHADLLLLKAIHSPSVRMPPPPPPRPAPPPARPRPQPLWPAVHAVHGVMAF